MYSVCDNLTVGFPHSEISGSKLICQLPEAYRRLSRPSSPVIAKASTTCTYSLDPITLVPTALQVCPHVAVQDKVTSRFAGPTMSGMMTLSIRSVLSHGTFLIRLFEFLKNDSRPGSDIRSGNTGSDLRSVIGGGERDRTDDPLLAKQVLSQLSYTPETFVGGGSGWIRTNDPRLIKTVL